MLHCFQILLDLACENMCLLNQGFILSCLVSAKSNEANPIDASRLDMRVGKIVGVQVHPDADTLYIEKGINSFSHFNMSLTSHNFP